MSYAPYRRRRRRRRAVALAGDPFILFLDAITDVLGVVMFLLLMVVLAARASPAMVKLAAQPSSDLARVRLERDELVAKVSALPPPGDPDLAARWKAALARIAELRPGYDSIVQDARARLAAIAAARQKQDAEAAAVQALAARVTELKNVSRGALAGVVRVSRFQADQRKPVLLALDKGALSLVKVTHDTQAIAPPAAGVRVPDAAAARAALTQLLAGTPPTTHRVELIVWANAFAEAKIVEQVLLEMGYDTNPLPVMDGKSLTPGAGGVQ